MNPDRRHAVPFIGLAYDIVMTSWYDIINIYLWCHYMMQHHDIVNESARDLTQRVGGAHMRKMLKIL